MQVFAPLARLLGLYSIKEELEELAFSYSMPEQYTQLRLHLDRLAKEQGTMVMQVPTHRRRVVELIRVSQPRARTHQGPNTKFCSKWQKLCMENRSLILQAQATDLHYMLAPPCPLECLHL